MQQELQGTVLELHLVVEVLNLKKRVLEVMDYKLILLEVILIRLVDRDWETL